MASCPRCGAVNQPGKAACWKCLAPIAPPPPARQTPPTPSPAPKLAAPVRRKLSIPNLTVAFPRRHARPEQPVPAPAVPTEEPKPDVIIEEPLPAPVERALEPTVEEATLPEPAVTAEPVPEEELVPDKPAEEISAEHTAEKTGPEGLADEPVTPTPDGKPFALADEEEEEEAPHEFIYVAEPRRKRGDTRWVAIILVLALLLSGIFILWHHDFRAVPLAATPRQAAQQYLFALAMNDQTTRQQLAAPDSRGLQLPTWFTVAQASFTGVTDTDAGTAKARARLILAPINSGGFMPTLNDAASRAYNVEFSLQRSGDGWRVDQRTLFRSLRWQMKQQNPTVTFPPWEGVSE